MLATKNSEGVDHASDNQSIGCRYHNRSRWHQIDTGPATPVDFANGHLTGYENTAGAAGDTGGTDTNLSVQIVAQSSGAVPTGGGGGAIDLL